MIGAKMHGGSEANLCGLSPGLQSFGARARRYGISSNYLGMQHMPSWVSFLEPVKEEESINQ